MKIVAGHQPNYLPYLGFFDKLKKCDLFFVADNVHFERQGFTNRNRIKISNGVKWLTVPTEHCGCSMPINEIKIANKSNPNWRRQHWLTLKQNYCKAPFWKQYCDFFERAYSQEWFLLVDLNLYLLKTMMRFFEIETPLVLLSSLRVSGERNDLVLAACKAMGADVYLSGIGAREYLRIETFEKEGIKVIFQDFQHPKYNQLHGDFATNLSAIDYLFNTGGTMFHEE